MSTSGRYHHGDLRRALIEAAVALVEREGTAGLTLRRVAGEVGVTHAAVYRHFKDKQALVDALAVEGMAGMRDAMGASLAGRSDAVDAFYAFCAAYVTYAVEHPAHFRLMYRGDVRQGPIADAKEEMMGMFIAGVEACQGTGEFAPGPPEPQAVMAWSLAHGLAALVVDGALARSHATASTVRATFWSFTKSMRSTSSEGR